MTAKDLRRLLRSRGCVETRQKGRKASSASKEIVELSLRYGLISRETSFVAVERRETPVQGDIQLRRVPIALTSGWGGIEHRRQATLRDAASARLGAYAAMNGLMKRLRSPDYQTGFTDRVSAFGAVSHRSSIENDSTRARRRRACTRSSRFSTQTAIGNSVPIWHSSLFTSVLKSKRHLPAPQAHG
jgi:hypothetical protein